MQLLSFWEETQSVLEFYCLDMVGKYLSNAHF